MNGMHEISMLCNDVSEEKSEVTFDPRFLAQFCFYS